MKLTQLVETSESIDKERLAQRVLSFIAKNLEDRVTEFEPVPGKSTAVAGGGPAPYRSGEAKVERNYRYYNSGSHYPIMMPVIFILGNQHPNALDTVKRIRHDLVLDVLDFLDDIVESENDVSHEQRHGYDIFNFGPHNIRIKHEYASSWCSVQVIFNKN